LANEAVDRGFSNSQIHVSGYGVDLPRIRSVITESPCVEREYDAVYVGRFHAQKGLTDLVTIWRRVLEIRPHARLAVIGDGHSPEAIRFKKELERMPRGSVRHLGVLTGSEKYRAIGRARVLAFPSHHESWGHVVIEAMAAGLPVVGYDIPSSRETFGEAVKTIPVGDTDGFADAIVGLLCNPAAYAEYQRRGLEVAERSDWDRIAEAFFQRIIG
jgi:glycosyltransferase involved in cell wall biosynthesis